MTHVTSLNPYVMLVALKACRNPPEANGVSTTTNTASTGTWTITCGQNQTYRW